MSQASLSTPATVPLSEGGAVIKTDNAGLAFFKKARWALLAFFIGLFAFAWLMPQPMTLLKESWIVCHFKRMLHLPCPTCGMTRAFVLISRGEWAEALRYNWLSLPTYMAFATTAVGSFVAPAKTLGLLKILRHWPVLVLMGMVLVGVWVVKLTGDPAYW